MNNIVIFEPEDQPVQVRLEGESVWLSLQHLAEMFGRDKSAISRHLKSIFEAKDLERESVVAKNATTAADGTTYQVECFNLDAFTAIAQFKRELVAKGEATELSASCAGMGWHPASPPSSRGLETSCSIPMSPDGRPICCIW